MHFDPADLAKAGYHVQTGSKIPERVQAEFVKHVVPDRVKQTLKNKASHAKHKFRYMNDKHKSFCEKKQYGPDALLEQPLIRKQVRYDYSFLKSPI